MAKGPRPAAIQAKRGAIVKSEEKRIVFTVEDSSDVEMLDVEETTKGSVSAKLMNKVDENRAAVPGVRRSKPTKDSTTAISSTQNYLGIKRQKQAEAHGGKKSFTVIFAVEIKVTNKQGRCQGTRVPILTRGFQAHEVSYLLV